MKIRLEKNDKQSLIRTLIVILLSVALAFVCCGLIVANLGKEPMEVFKAMWESNFVKTGGIERMIKASLPLVFCSLGVALTFRMNLSNIGAEGQYIMGFIAGGAFALFGPKIEGVPGLLIMAVLGALGGALWSMFSALPKAFWGVSESITSLMMNYVAISLLKYLCQGPWKKQGAPLATTERLPEGLKLPTVMIGDTEISIGFIIGIIVAVLIFLAYKYTTGGYQWTVIRHNPTAARYAGINLKKNIILAMAISGGLAGLGGFVQYTGVTQVIKPNIASGVGYTAIVIAYLSRLNPLAAVVVSVLFAGLQNSGTAIQRLGVPSEIATMMQGLIMIFVIAGEFFQRYKIVVTKEGRE